MKILAFFSRACRCRQLAEIERRVRNAELRHRALRADHSWLRGQLTQLEQRMNEQMKQLVEQINGHLEGIGNDISALKAKIEAGADNSEIVAALTAMEERVSAIDLAGDQTTEGA